MFSVYGTKGQVLDLFGRCELQRAGSPRGHIPSPLCPWGCAVEEPIPNPTLASLKALYLCSSPGEFHSITENYLVFLCFLVISCWDV